MFSKQKLPTNGSLTVSAPSSNSGSIPSIIASDLRIVGNLMCSGSIEIEGEVEGNVTCGQVTVRRTGSVKGDVTADSIQVDGEINGLVKGRDIVLAESGRVTGVIMYESLSVKDGAYIDGQCKSADKLHRGEVEAIENQRSERVLVNEKEEAMA
jgi:cytoskeletal protein CcmA (bactofilin family)